MEERYFADDAAFEDLEIAEDELIDQYVRGELSRRDADRFEKNLAASPRLIQRVKNARVLTDRLRAASAPAPATAVGHPREVHQMSNWWANLFGTGKTPRFAVAFIVVLVLIGGFFWLRLRERSRLAEQQAAIERQHELDRQAAERKSQADQLASQSPQPSPTQVSSPPKQTSNQNSLEIKPILAFALYPGGTRSTDGAQRDFRITPGTEQVVITLHVSDPDYTSYQPTISQVGGGVVLPPRSLNARKTESEAVVIVRIPARKLPPGDYLIDLKGRTSTGTTERLEGYSFRIVK